MRALVMLLALAGCGNPAACLANAYDGSPPQRVCTSGLTLPYGLLKEPAQP